MCFPFHAVCGVTISKSGKRCSSDQSRLFSWYRPSWSYFALSKKTSLYIQCNSKKFCFEERAKYFEALLCHCEYFMRDTLLGISNDLSLECSFWSGVHPVQLPGSASSTTPWQTGQGAAHGSFGGCGLSSVLPLHSPAAMHYQGRAEDGSRNLVWFLFLYFVSLGSTAQGCCKWGCDMGLMTLFLGSLQRKTPFPLAFNPVSCTKDTEETLKSPRGSYTKVTAFHSYPAFGVGLAVTPEP